MAEKVKLNEFLTELINLLNKNLDSVKDDVTVLKSEIRRIKADQKKDSLNEIEKRIRSIETTLNTARDLNMVDKSILKMLEVEESARRT